MRGQSESVDPGLIFLKFFNIRIDELNLAATFFADEVVVMGDPVARFISCDAVPEIDLFCYTGLSKEFDSTVDRSLPYGRVRLPDDVIYFLGRKVSIGIKERVQDDSSLGGHLQSLTVEVPCESGALFDHIPPGIENHYQSCI